MNFHILWCCWFEKWHAVITWSVMYKCRINKLDPLGAGLVDLLLKQANRPFSYPFENPDMLHTCRSLRKLDLFLTWQEVTEASDFEECNCNSSLNGGMSEWELLEHSRHAIPGYLWVFFSGSPTPGNRDLGTVTLGVWFSCFTGLQRILSIQQILSLVSAFQLFVK